MIRHKIQCILQYSQLVVLRGSGFAVQCGSCKCTGSPETLHQNKQIPSNCHENIYCYYPSSILQYGQGQLTFPSLLWKALGPSAFFLFFFFSPSGAKAAAKGSRAETSTSTLNDRMHREHGAPVGICRGPMESQIMLGTLRGRQRTNKLEQSQRQIKPLRKFKKCR